jgi:hypothetical protein
VNIQRGKDGNAKAYQVRQVLDAIAKLEASTIALSAKPPNSTTAPNNHGCVPRSSKSAAK